MTLTGVHHLVVMIRVPSAGSRVQEVMEILEASHVKKEQVTVLPYSDGDKSQVLFMFTCSRECQLEISTALASIGIGEYGSGTDVNVLPLALAKDVRKAAEKEADEEQDQPEESKTKGKSLSVFQSTIKARIAVENMLEMVHEGASFSFDFFMLVIVASVIALIGLLTNSSVSIVAAMLVSPLMGPILGFTFGSVVRDKELVRTALKSEIISIMISMMVGFIGGLLAAPAAMRSTPWPTYEMASRGDPSSLYIGVAIAIPSGVGVALSIMGQNTNSLVGVAISASLLPPVVNSGLFFAQASLAWYYYTPSCLSNGNTVAIWKSCCNENLPSSTCPANNDLAFCCTNTYYSPSDFARMGGISFALTIVNIACVWLFGALTFMLKEVAPLPNKSELWTTIVPNARRFNIAMNRGEIQQEDLKKELLRRTKLQGRVSTQGHRLTRDFPIGKGGLQERQVGATGMAFGTQGLGTRGMSNDILAHIKSLFEVNPERDDRDDNGKPKSFELDV